MQKKYFITFEGLDTCGKSTQIDLLEKYLKSKNLNVVKTFEPGATSLGEKLRKIILKPNGVIKMPPLVEAFLYAADRAQHVAEIIKPALEKNWTVISDRYVDSSLAYQGYIRNLGVEFIKKINEPAMENIYPNLTFFIDISPQEIMKRFQGKKLDRIENDIFKHHIRLRDAYIELAKSNPHRIVTINGNRTIIETFDEIKKIVDERLNDTK